MNEKDYRKAYFTDPEPSTRYQFSGTFGVTLYFEEYDAAAAYYEQVLGVPGYTEGEGTKGWKIGPGWLTLLRGTSGGPQNVEVTLQLESQEEAEKLQQAFIEAGGTGSPPSNELMYEPIRFCPVRDPFGTDLLIISRRAA